MHFDKNELYSIESNIDGKRISLYDIASWKNGLAFKNIDFSDSGMPVIMLMYGKEASNRKQEIDRQHYTIPNQRPKDKHCGKI